MYAGPWRHARSLTVGAVCVALSVAGHLAGGGSAPDLAHAPVAVLGLVVVTALLCLALGFASRRRWSFGRAVLALGLGQAVLHAAFALVLVPGGSPGGAASATMPGMAGWHTGRHGRWGTPVVVRLRLLDGCRAHRRGAGGRGGDRPDGLRPRDVVHRVGREDAGAPCRTAGGARRRCGCPVGRGAPGSAPCGRRRPDATGCCGRRRVSASTGAARPAGDHPGRPDAPPRALATHHACVLPASTDATKGLPCSCSIAPSGACSVVPGRPLPITGARRRTPSTSRPSSRRRARRRRH